MTFDKTSLVAAGSAKEGGNPDDEDTRVLAQCAEIIGAIRDQSQEQREAGEAIVDCGAAGSIGGAKACELLGRLLGPEQIQIDKDDRPWFICEDGSRQRAMSKVTLQTTAGRRSDTEKFYVLDAPTG